MEIDEYRKYDAMVEKNPGIWWDREGQLGGLHLLNEVRARYFKEKLGSLAGKRVLDIGCGGGILAEWLAREGAKVTGADPSEKSLASARRHAETQGLQIKYVHGSAEELSFPEPFDAIFAVDVLEHVNDLEKSLDTCARLLKNGGHFGFLTHNQTLEAFTELIWNGEYVLQAIPKGNHDFHKFIAPELLKSLLEKRGLAVKNISGIERDREKQEVRFTDNTMVSYLGYAVKG